MSDPTTKEQAEQCFRKAYKAQMSGRLDEAIDLYQQSIELYPTAKAYTFLGWSLSFRDELDKAIAACEHAIEIDPDFGNPYNDIGSYLIRKGEFESAIPWLEKACTAPNYDARHYPYYNLGRVYERLGEYQEAISHYNQAAKLEPSYKTALQSAERLQASMN